MSDLRQSFLDAMSNVAATVSVVATDGPGGRAGVTVSAMSSVSADTEKPVLLVCVNEQSAGATPLSENGVFSVNILRDDQSFVSDTFAGRFGDKGEDKFACARWSCGVTGAPTLEGALAVFDCRLIDSRKVGKHYVMFGAVEEVRLGDAGRALIYANRSYGTPLSLPPAHKPGDADDAGRLCIACVSSFAPFHIPALLARFRAQFPDTRADVIEGDQAQVANLIESGEASCGLLYDRDIRSSIETERLLEQHPYVLLSANDPRIDGGVISLRDLSADPLVLLDQPPSRGYVTAWLAKLGIEPSSIINASTFEMTRSLVANGLGYSILVTRPASNCSYDGKPLATAQIAEDTEDIAIALAFPNGRSPSDVARQFMRFTRQHFEQVKEGRV